MTVVNVFSDNELRHTLLAHHPHGHNFKDAWHGAMIVASATSRHWTVAEVFEYLRGKGWQIIDADTVEVAY